MGSGEWHLDGDEGGLSWNVEEVEKGGGISRGDGQRVGEADGLSSGEGH